MIRKIPERSAFNYFPPEDDYDSLKRAAEGCRGCDLYLDATQTVFGEGDLKPKLVFVGEQPGDEEDIKGHPFVGPAGRLFDQALAEVGIDRSETYITNTVKHFKWKPAGKRRLHERPRASEIKACLPWLWAEIELLGPPILVCLGATASQALLGPEFRVTQMRGQWLRTEFSQNVLATVHPSSILRSQNRDEEYRWFVTDLQLVADKLAAIETR
ncbi:MAG: UdgX family uracil-DNA binding protein [Pyrinomonadaceae bacterium]